MSFSLKTSTLLWLAALLALPSLLHAQSTQSRTRFLRWAYQDVAGLAHDFSQGRTPFYALGAIAMLTPLSTLDKSIDYEIHEFGGVASGFLDFANELGDPLMNIPVAGIFAVSLLTDDTRFQDAAFTSLQSLIYTGAISYGIKSTVGRFRPYEQNGSHRFAPFSGNSSFPSGHTTAAFAIMTPWVLYYPHPVTYGLFALSTGTAIARVVREKHWATDVLAGSTLGFFTAYYLTRRHQNENKRFTITPILGANTASVTVRMKW
ncbi:MAG: phosphatase PAP2 family protein [Rhodothermales bacterium]